MKGFATVKLKLTIYKICILIVTQISFTSLYGQIDVFKNDSLIADCKAQVNEIDNQVLYKTLLDYDGYRVGSENSVNEWLVVLYFDDAGRLRKSKLIFYFAGDEGYYISYFNERGIAIHSMYYTYSGMNGGHSATRYLDEEGELLFVDYISRDDDRDGQLIEQIKRRGGYGLEIPKEEGSNYDKIMNIDSLKTTIKYLFDVDSIYKPKNYMLVKLDVPQAGDTTSINSNGVALYEKASFNSSIITHLDVSGFNVIVTKNHKDWSKIKCNGLDKPSYTEGYVRTEYLSLIEKRLRNNPKDKE